MSDFKTATAGGDLVASYHNRNLDNSRIMGIKSGQAEHLQQGLYKASLNMGTSQVNLDDVATNKAKIVEYKHRMQQQKQALGY